MKKLLIVIFVLLCSVSCSSTYPLIEPDCSSTHTLFEPDNYVVCNSIVVWRDDSGNFCIKMFYEITNLSKTNQCYFPSDFDILDENDNLIYTFTSTNAYPPIIGYNETTVYANYGHIEPSRLSFEDNSLRVIPHIEYENTTANLEEFAVTAISVFGSSAMVTVENYHIRKDGYRDVQVVVIFRETSSNQVVSVLVSAIDLLYPADIKTVKLKEPLEQRAFDPDLVKYQMLAYTEA